jgi:hypothetical protein
MMSYADVHLLFSIIVELVSLSYSIFDSSSSEELLSAHYRKTISIPVLFDTNFTRKPNLREGIGNINETPSFYSSQCTSNLMNNVKTIDKNHVFRFYSFFLTVDSPYPSEIPFPSPQCHRDAFQQPPVAMFATRMLPSMIRATHHPFDSTRNDWVLWGQRQPDHPYSPRKNQ